MPDEQTTTTLRDNDVPIERREQEPISEKQPDVGYGHLIRIPKEEDQEKAIVAFRRVARTRCRVGEDLFLLTTEHVEALKREKIFFLDVSGDGQSHA